MGYGLCPADKDNDKHPMVGALSPVLNVKGPSLGWNPSKQISRFVLERNHTSVLAVVLLSLSYAL